MDIFVSCVWVEENCPSVLCLGLGAPEKAHLGKTISSVLYQELSIPDKAKNKKALSEFDNLEQSKTEQKNFLFFISILQH